MRAHARGAEDEEQRPRGEWVRSCG
jgi:hypothetical protein